MARRIAHVLLFFAGLAPGVWAVCIFPVDPRRAAVLAALAALGLALNGVALARPAFGLRLPLRIIACGTSLVVLASVMGMWHRIRMGYLPHLLAAGDPLARHYRATAQNLLWIAAAVFYVFVILVLLPGLPDRPGREGRAPGRRIDFRSYGR